MRASTPSFCPGNRSSETGVVIRAEPGSTSGAAFRVGVATGSNEGLESQDGLSPENASRFTFL